MAAVAPQASSRLESGLSADAIRLGPAAARPQSPALRNVSIAGAVAETAQVHPMLRGNVLINGSLLEGATAGSGFPLGVYMIRVTCTDVYGVAGHGFGGALRLNKHVVFAGAAGTGLLNRATGAVQARWRSWRRSRRTATRCRYPCWASPPPPRSVSTGACSAASLATRPRAAASRRRARATWRTSSTSSSPRPRTVRPCGHARHRCVAAQASTVLRASR